MASTKIPDSGEWCWMDGKFVKLADAAIPLRDLTVFRGYGVFDFFRTYSGIPLLLSHSLARFRNSANLVGLTVPYTDQQLTEAVLATLQKNHGIYSGESGVRLILTGGVTLDGLSSFGKPCTVVVTQSLSCYAATCYSEGIKVITVPMHRFIPEAKHLNYLPAVVYVKKAKEVGATEAIYINPDTKVVYEGTVSNIFIVKNGVLITPENGVLLGITRKHVIQIAKEKFTVEQREVKLEELLQADEVFLTAANKRIMPVVKVDDHQIGNGKPGDRTKQLMKMFDEITIEAAKKMAV